MIRQLFVLNLCAFAALREISLSLWPLCRRSQGSWDDLSAIASATEDVCFRDPGVTVRNAG